MRAVISILFSGIFYIRATGFYFIINQQNSTVMRRMSWLLPFVLLWFGGSAQTGSQSFVIVNSGSVTNIADYIEALKINDLDRFRALEYRTVMQFQEGVVAELLSGNEMVQLGLSVDLSQVNATNVDRMRHSQFTLHSSGRILELVTPVKKGQ